MRLANVIMRITEDDDQIQPVDVRARYPQTSVESFRRMTERTTLDRVRVTCPSSDPPRPLRDVQITAPEGTRLAELVDILANEPGTAVRPSTVWSGSLRLESTAPLGGPGLRNGDVLRFGGPSRQDSTNAPFQVAVVGGPDAGKVVPLTRCETVVGRAGSCDLLLSDPVVSRRHLALAVTTSGVRVRDLRSTNGTRDRRPLDRHVRVSGIDRRHHPARRLDACCDLCARRRGCVDFCNGRHVVGKPAPDRRCRIHRRRDRLSRRS